MINEFFSRVHLKNNILRITTLKYLFLLRSFCRRQEKGYEEVHVPALKPKSFADDEQVRNKLLSTQETFCNSENLILIRFIK